MANRKVKAKTKKALTIKSVAKSRTKTSASKYKQIAIGTSRMYSQEIDDIGRLEEYYNAHVSSKTISKVKRAALAQ